MTRNARCKGPTGLREWAATDSTAADPHATVQHDTCMAQGLDAERGRAVDATQDVAAEAETQTQTQGKVNIR